MITLYDFQLSAPCYAVRLFLALLDLPHHLHPLDIYPGAEHHAPWFRALSPFGRVPVLADGEVVLADPIAILVYLATRHDPGGPWYPTGSADRLGEITEWLSLARELDATAGLARRAHSFGDPADLPRARAEAATLLARIDRHLWYAERRGEPFLCPGPRPTLADLACFPPLALAEEGGIAHRPYPALRRWLDRVRRLPGFVVMPGIFPASPLAAPG